MDRKAAEAKLVNRREELRAKLSEIEHQLDEPASKDWEDRASERQGDEVLEALGMSERRELDQIAAALQRIEAGTYGECQGCGGDISQARLDLLPATPLCKTCAAARA